MKLRREPPPEVKRETGFIEGVVKWWDVTRQFGILEADRPRAATVHCSASAAWAATGHRWLEQGAKVRFKVRQFDGGNTTAWDVELVDAEPATERSGRWRAA